MDETRRKLLAVVEVILVVFGVVPLLTLGVYAVFPRFESWQTDHLHFPFPVFVHVVMIGTSLLLIGIRRRRLRDYGLVFRDLRTQLSIAGTCFLPVVLAGVPLGMGVDYRRWGGALILSAVQAGLLCLLGWLLRKKPSPAMPVAVVGIAILMPQARTLSAIQVGQAVAVFLTYAVFVGFGEEILHRGYVQTRLNDVFGTPYRFFGAPFGWGTLIAALMFGLTHAGILTWVLGRSGQVTLAWAAWTTVGGAVFALVREKSGSILPGALLHGLPQAIAEVVLLLL